MSQGQVLYVVEVNNPEEGGQAASVWETAGQAMSEVVRIEETYPGYYAVTIREIRCCIPFDAGWEPE
jgi:hypothetical protein